MGSQVVSVSSSASVGCCEQNKTSLQLLKLQNKMIYRHLLLVLLIGLIGLVKSQEGGGGRRRPLDGRSDDQTELRSGPGRVRSPLLRGRQRALQSQEDEAEDLEVGGREEDFLADLVDRDPCTTTTTMTMRTMMTTTMTMITITRTTSSHHQPGLRPPQMP